MASGNSLVLKFGTMSGIKTWTFSGVKAEPTPSQVKTLMDTMITNGSIYRYPPMTKESAVVRVVTETNYDLSGD